ncbi:MAG TPA: ABC transporter ATP-binding protein [Streptosporangiaceae bacterium]|jgi:ABC-type lipoprotein export system ATPase subunit|nr:ABC transporter ATP-binding protein [Streptosporangiaceae bacterium]
MTGIDDLIARQQAISAERAREQATEAMIACDRLVRIYSVAGVETQALQGLDLLVQPGELTALVGASGSGKSTLLNILAGLDLPTGGKAIVAGHDLLTMKGKERLSYRRSTVGFLWQQTGRNLLGQLTAAENVMLPMELARLGRGQRAARARSLLRLLGLEQPADRLVSALSGGQQQRVAIGVALANSPSVVLADEPTGELDTQSADEVFAALRLANAETGVTMLVVTHDASVSEQVNRTIAIRDGRISTEVLRTTATNADGEAERQSQEYSVLDRAGRLQLPVDFIAALDLKSRVRLALEPDHVGVWPDRQAASTREAR